MIIWQLFYSFQNVFTTKKGCGIMLDRIKVLDSMISPLKNGRSCHQRCAWANFFSSTYLFWNLPRLHLQSWKKRSPEEKTHPLRTHMKLRNFTLLVLSKLLALDFNVSVSTKRFINLFWITLPNSARPNGNHSLLLVLMFLLRLVMVYNLVPRYHLQPIVLVHRIALSCLWRLQARPTFLQLWLVD